MHIETNKVDKLRAVAINKVDAETGKNEPQGYGSLAGAKYDVFFYDPIKSEDVKVATLTTENMTVTDVFTFENLIKGQKYVLKGELLDKATGKVVTKAEKTFTARTIDGDVKLDFKFDGSKYAENGAEFVVTEKLYSLFNGKEKLVASHVDINDLSQTVNVPNLKTTATDKIDDGKDLNAGEKQTIIDKVEYKNLYAGKEYKVSGVLMNKATGKPILVDGKEITAEKVFTPKETRVY